MSDIRPHKFIASTDSDEVYVLRVFCEYCGHIAFNGNQSKSNIENQAEAKKGCPCAPQPPKENK